MAKTQMNARVDEARAQAARVRALARGVSVNRHSEALVQRDAAEVGRSFVDAAADFMKRYESAFAEELDTVRAAGTTEAAGAGEPAAEVGAGPEACPRRDRTHRPRLAAPPRRG